MLDKFLIWTHTIFSNTFKTNNTKEMFLVVFFKEFAIFHLCKQKDEFLKREHQRFHAIVISSQCPKLTNITHNVQNLSITKYFTMLFEKTSHNCINFIHCTVSIQYNLSYLHTFHTLILFMPSYFSYFHARAFDG